MVGPIATYAAMTELGAEPGIVIFKILILHFLAPALIAFSIHLLMKKIGWVKDGDMKL